MEIRSFLAFELPSDIKEIISGVLGEFRGSHIDMRWVRIEGIHLTVVFLGQIREEDVESIGAEVGRVCRDYDRFRVHIQGVGCFPNRRNPRVVWIGLEGDLDRMGGFRDDIQEALADFDVKQEKRPFRPHLTLGRIKQPGRKNPDLDKLMLKHAGLSSREFVLEELFLFRSDIRPGGAVYTKLRSWRLKTR